MVTSAIPGTTESVFPVGIIILGKQQCSLMNSPGSLMNYAELSDNQLTSMADGIKVSKNDMDVRLISPQLVQRENGKPIDFVDWWPLLHGYRFPKDAIIAIAAVRESVHSKRLQLDDAYMAKAALLARTASGSHRMAVLVCQQDVGKTSNTTFGLGASVANASASTPTTTALGFGHGSGDSWMGEVPAGYVAALNDYEGAPYTQYAPAPKKQQADQEKPADAPAPAAPKPDQMQQLVGLVQQLVALQQQHPQAVPASAPVPPTPAPIVKTVPAPMVKKHVAAPPAPAPIVTPVPAPTPAPVCPAAPATAPPAPAPCWTFWGWIGHLWRVCWPVLKWLLIGALALILIALWRWDRGRQFSRIHRMVTATATVDATLGGATIIAEEALGEITEREHADEEFRRRFRERAEPGSTSGRSIAPFSSVLLRRTCISQEANQPVRLFILSTPF